MIKNDTNKGLKANLEYKTKESKDKGGSIATEETQNELRNNQININQIILDKKNRHRSKYFKQ